PDLALARAQMWIGAPCIVALRGLARVCGGHDALSKPGLRDAAAQVAWAFRGLFNIPEVIALVRGLNREEPYWRRVVEYCVAGGLQAVIDEYAHVLRESLGLLDTSAEDTAQDLARAMCSALSIRTVTLRLDELRVAD